MEGFFTRKEVESLTRPDGKLHTCVSCGLHKNVLTPKMAPYGKFKKGIMILGEAPGEIEDRVGLPWQGKTGKLLNKTLQEIGINLFEDCVSINACHCHPTDEKGQNRAPTNIEVDSCRKTTIQYIKHYKPKVILVLGASALYSLLGYRWKKDLSGIFKWRGFTIPDQDFQTWLAPTFHPSYVERDESGVEKVIWKQDLKNAILLLNKPFPVFEQPEIKIIQDISVLNAITEPFVSFDFETTGIKPHASGHKIVSCAVATSDNFVYAFLLPQSRKEREPLINLLRSETMGKIAHNMKYEYNWAKIRLRTTIKNLVWDTMLASHLLDNRTGITSLKFQAYVIFGVIDYSSELNPYLHAKEEGSNSINEIDKLIATTSGIKMLLKYNAMDAIFTYRLAKQQRSLFQEHDLPF